MEVRVKYHNNSCRLNPIDKGDWIDLKAGKRVVIKNGEMALIPLGVSMELPEGKEAWVEPRSSTYKTWGIIMTNMKGIIDNSYNGDGDIWRFPALCLDGKVELYKPTPIRRLIEKVIPELAWFRFGTVICEGDRICQFRIADKMQVGYGGYEFKEVESLGNKDRGGFGSTGVN